MISSEVQRTLVKSPPELWTELSDPVALARHLGEFGEIRITRVEDEKAVEWESDTASGTVRIKPSGWGTKVTLSVSRELPRPEHAQPAAGPAAAAHDAPAEPPAADPAATEHDAREEPPAAEFLDAELLAAEPAADAPPVPGQVDEARTEVDDAAEAGTEHAPAEVPDGEWFDDAGAALHDEPEEYREQLEAPPATEPRRGFFARLFGRRGRAPAETTEFDAAPAEEAVGDDPPQPALTYASATTALDLADEGDTAEFEAAPRVDTPAPVPAQPAPAQPAPAQPTPAQPETSAGHAAPPVSAAEPPAVDLAAELAAAEEVAVEEVTAVLTGVLDRLGAAHHRPFSRS